MAVDILRRTSGQGDGNAAFCLGMLTYYGIGVEQNEEESIKLLTIAASRGYYDAYFYLSLLALKNVRDEEAGDLISQGSENHVFGCRFLLAKREKSSRIHEDMIRSISSKANVSQQVRFGKLFDKFLKFTDYAKELWNMAEGNGSAEGKFLLAKQQVSNDDEKESGMAKLRDLCTEANFYRDAGAFLGSLLIKQADTIEEGWTLINRAANDGSGEALFLLGVDQCDGRSTGVKNYDMGLRYLNQAAESGHVRAAKRVVHLCAEAGGRRANPTMKQKFEKLAKERDGTIGTKLFWLE
jgi:TPR repeat protein